MIVLAMIGNILVSIFTSSTCVTVQTFHGSGVIPSGIIAALSSRRNCSVCKIFTSQLSLSLSSISYNSSGHSGNGKLLFRMAIAMTCDILIMGLLARGWMQ